MVGKEAERAYFDLAHLAASKNCWCIKEMEIVWIQYVILPCPTPPKKMFDMHAKAVEVDYFNSEHFIWPKKSCWYVKR